MTIKEMNTLSDEELKRLSMRKSKKGTYTTEANRAMKIRRERSCFWDDVAEREKYGDPSYHTPYDECWMLGGDSYDS